MKRSVLIALIFVMLAAGCVQQHPANEITLPGQPTYVFSEDVREALKYPVSDANATRNIILGNSQINIIFNGSSAKDDTHFQVVLFNTVTKIKTYTHAQGWDPNFDTYYLLNETWHDTFNNNISTLTLEGAVIEVKGPETGATNNSISLKGNTILLQGTDYVNLALAGDKLALIVMGVNHV